MFSRVTQPRPREAAVKNVVRNLLLAAGVWIDRVTPDSDTAALIRSLRPTPTDRQLIRIGPRGDGGYLIPDDLDGLVACVSPGVSTECGFDLQLAARGVDIFMADASVSAPPVAHPRFHFAKLFLDTYNSEVTTTLDDMCKKIPSQGDLLLQMDIEGAEYRVIASAQEDTLKRFRIIVIEFHDLANMFTRVGFREINSVFSKLLLSHNVVHIHPNNVAPVFSRHAMSVPTIMEFTFYRSDRVSVGEKNLVFHIPWTSETLVVCLMSFCPIVGNNYL